LGDLSALMNLKEKMEEGDSAAENTEEKGE
jgi:hypothetical protein